jgi:glycosyltransferase involved in cell wall biosynthesis
VPLKLEWMQDAEPDVARTRRLVVALVHELKPDVLHANQFAAACADVDIPVVLTLHSDVLSWRRWTLGDSTVPAEYRSYVDLVQEALRRADRVVAVSQFLATEVRELYGCPRDIEVIHNGWPVPAEPADIRSGTFLAGRVWDPAKNIALAAHAARGWDPGSVLVAGNARHPDTGAVSELPLQFLGHLSRDELQRRLAAASIYLSPARYDPFGLLPLQAALNGCALLLSDIPSYRELWSNAAWFFRSDDADHLRQQWQVLLADPDLRAELAFTAHARAATHFNLERMANSYQLVYTTARRGVAA